MRASADNLCAQPLRCRLWCMSEHAPTRRISLASGVLPEFDAVTVARAAVAAGYSDAGLMVRPDEWDTGWEPELLDISAQSGLGFLDVEVLWIPAGGALDDSHRFIVEVGGRLGAEHLLVVSDEADAERIAPALKQISHWCAPHGIKPMLEFLRITPVTSLAQTRELLAACDDQDFGILLDSLHLARSGELQHLPALDAAQHPYLQLCDGLLHSADDPASLLEDAIDLRSAPGRGELNLQPLLQALPADTPLSMEVRSRAVREAYADPAARAAAVLSDTRDFLTKMASAEG